MQLVNLDLRYLRSHIRTARRLALLGALWAGIVYGQSDDYLIDRKIEHLNGKQVVQLSGFKNIRKHVWCGTEHLALQRYGENGGIVLLNISNGKGRQITSDTYHNVVACTADGRYAFFSDRRSRGRIEAIDVVTLKREVVSGALPNGYSAIRDRRARVSPSGLYVVGIDSNKIAVNLGNRSLRLVDLPRPGKDEFANGITWAGEDYVYLLITQGSAREKFLEIDANTGHLRTIAIPRVPDYVFTKIESFGRSKVLYLLGWPDSDKKKPALFRFDLTRDSVPPEVIVSDLQNFTLLPSGDIIYEKHIGVDYSNHMAKIDKVARRDLIVKTATGQEIVLATGPYRSTSFGEVVVSPSGHAVTISENRRGAGLFVFVMELTK